MSAETITTAIFLITAVVATAVLVNAIYPVIYSTAGTFQSSTHAADVNMRTDFKIVATFANSTHVNVWMKNIGSQRISYTDILSSDVFFGPVGNYDRVSDWEFTRLDLENIDWWDTGETLQITVRPSPPLSTNDMVYFQFVLPGGIWRSTEFTAS